MKIIPEEAQDTSSQDQGNEWNPDILEEKRNPEECDTDDQGSPGRQAIQSIDQIQSIGDADHPKDRDRDGQQTQVKHTTGERIGDIINPDAEEKQKASGKNLSQKFKPGLQIDDIIEDPHHQYDDLTQEQGFPLIGQKFPDINIVQDIADKECEIQGKENRDAP